MFRALAFTTLILLGGTLFLACTESSEDPSGTVKAYALAAQRKEIGKMKALLSKGSLEMFGAVAEVKGTTVEELLAKEAVFAPSRVEVRLVSTEGDLAVVEILNELTGEYDIKMPLVREDGSWKLARDIYTRENPKK
jgi:hypothetical protein